MKNCLGGYKMYKISEYDGYIFISTKGNKSVAYTSKLLFYYKK